jgi:triacylglycerol lipase
LLDGPVLAEAAATTREPRKIEERAHVVHHIYLSPGMFGFARLASYDYFGHVERALEARFRKAGHTIETHVSDVLPTSSVRQRALHLQAAIAKTATGDGPIHLLGHSTGGLDVRVVASPGAHFSSSVEERAWLPRLRSVTTMNTPHHGTPLASFFATSKGQQALFALSAFTVVALSVGERPLAIAGALIGLLRRGDRALGITPAVVQQSVEPLLALAEDARSPDVRRYLRAITNDQGAMVQLSPEAMDLINVGFEDRPGVRYQSTVSMAPTPSARAWLRTSFHPWSALSLALFGALHGITARHHECYPCARVPHAGEGTARPLQATETMLAKALGQSPDFHDNDGCVPIRSQLWGTLVWAGRGDHLDVLGHYRDVTPEQRRDQRHHDWLTSGSHFDDESFESLMDAVASGMMLSCAATDATSTTAVPEASPLPVRAPQPTPGAS